MTDRPIYHTRSVAVAIEQRRGGRVAKSAGHSIAVPTDMLAGNAELTVSQGGHSLRFEMPWSELQRAESVTLVFDGNSFMQAEITEAEPAAPSQPRARGARAWREADGSLRVSYDYDAA